MDLEQRERRQSRRVIISEILMFITVIITVVILAFVVSGYWINSDFKVERQGLLQVSSVPTGADVEIDGESGWLQRTNISKVLSSGEHTIKLTKGGYDSWSRTINIKEGLLYRIRYPRLFPNVREKETVYDLTATTFATISPDHGTMLLANNTTSWTLLNLENDKLSPKTLQLPADFPFTSRVNVTATGLFNGEIVSTEWAPDNEHLLLSLKFSESTEWVLLNVKAPENSINLTKAFSADFTELRIFDRSASNLIALLNGNLHRIDIPARQISAVLVENVECYDFYDSTIVFSAKNSDASVSEIPGDTLGESTTTPYKVGFFRLGSSDVTTITKTTTSALVAISRFYDDEYITVLDGATVVVYKKADLEQTFTATLDFSPTHFKVGQGGEFVTMWDDGTKIAALDMEAQEVRTWSPAASNFGWLDGNMPYAVADGVLNVYDFDGLNHRTLSSNVSTHFPITITADKWLYYVSDNSLIREWLIEK